MYSSIKDNLNFDIAEIQNFINAERLSKDEDEIPYMTTSIKADSEVTMGIVTDVKTELRKVNALKINYSTKKAKASKKSYPYLFFYKDK